MANINTFDLNQAQRRNYNPIACSFCKRRHRKCDGRPCSNCESKRECVFRAERNPRKNDGEVLFTNLGSLEFPHKSKHFVIYNKLEFI